MIKEPLALIVFIHEDLSDYSKEDLYNKHFSWLAEEIESISSRKMLIVLIRPSEAEALSNHPYQDEDADKSLYEWKAKIDHYRMTRPIQNLDKRFHKFLLLTRNPVNSRTLGIAQNPGYVAIASIIAARTAAHEVGHMFNAFHDDGEILYNGWWSETVMRPFDEFSDLRHDAQRFSDKNRENIRTYLNTPSAAEPVYITPRPDDEDGARN